MKRKILISAVCMALAMPQIAFAYNSQPQSPSQVGESAAELNGYSEEEWAKLMDNTLEYAEIDDLVKNFNPDINAAQSKYNENIDNLNDAIEIFKSEKRSMEGLESSAANSGDIQMSMLYKTQGKGLGLSIQAMGIAKEKLSREVTSANAPIRIARAQVSAGVRSMMIGYKTMELREAMLSEMVSMYEEVLNTAQKSKELGLMTETDTIKANSDLANAKANLTSLRASKDGIYKKLIMMCGWKPDATVVIADVPMLSDEELNALNPSVDINIAIGNNSALIKERHDTTSRSSTAVDAKLYKSAKDEDMLRANLNQMYDKIQSDIKALEVARVGNEAAQLTKNALETRKNLGMVSLPQYLGERIGIMQKQAEYESAILELRTDYNTYGQALLGNASLE